MIFIVILKPALKEKDLYYKLKQEKQDLVINEKDLKIKNLYEIKKLINKRVINKSFIFEVEGREKKNSLFSISLNEKFKNQHITCDTISMI